MNGGPKENANPTVLRVEKTVRCRQPLGWSAVQSLSSRSLSAGAGNSSSADRAIRQALRDADAATHGKGVSVLRNVGLELSSPAEKDCTAYFPAELGRRKRRFQKKEGSSKKNEKISCSSIPPAPSAARRDAIDADEIFEIIRNIQDPEHPLTLEQLGVVSRNQIDIEDDVDNNNPDDASLATSKLDVRFTPTIPHCSMATMIGLCIRVKLLRSLPPSGRFKVTVRIEPGTHNSESSVNKQLADKERVCAALENKHLLGVVNKCIKQGMNSSSQHSQ